MKVLICAYACIRNPDKRLGERGGEGVLGWNIARQMSRFNKVFVLTYAANQEAVEKRLLEEPIPGAKFFYIGLPHYLEFLNTFHGGVQLYAYLWQIKACFVAKKLHKEFNFDIFHHVTYANDWMASYIGAFLPVPYIRGPGGASPRIPKGFTDNYPLKNRIEEWLRFFGISILRRDPFFMMGQARAKKILVCNKESFDSIPEKWKNKTLLFPVTGVSSEELDSLSEESDRGDKFSVITVGRLIKTKGFDLSIKAFKLFSDKVPAAELIIAGSGPDELFLKDLINKLNLQDKVHLETKWTTHKELLKKMALSDVFLFPSLRDGGGNVVVEAMALGRPVICLDIGGPGLHINEKCGIKIKPQSPNQVIGEIAVAIERLHGDKELRAALGRNAGEKAKEFYYWDKLGDKLNEIYKKVL